MRQYKSVMLQPSLKIEQRVKAAMEVNEAITMKEDRTTSQGGNAGQPSIQMYQ